MTNTQETAAQQQWEAERSDRLLKVLAQAANLCVHAAVCYQDGQLCYTIALPGFCSWEPVHTLDECLMTCIEQELCRRQATEERKRYLNTVRTELLKTLTDDQKEALGL